MLLRTTRPLSLRELAEEVPGYPPGHEARRQAFERDKRTLREEGVVLSTEAIEGPEQMGYRIRPEDWYLPDLDLKPDEQAALNLAVAGVHIGDPSGRDALWRLGLPAPVTHRPVAEVPALPALPALFEAVRSRATVTFSYRGERRHVDPALLRFRQGRWYLAGLDRDRGAPRTFRVDRLEGHPIIGEPGSATLPEGFVDTLPDEPFQVGEGAPVTVAVLIDAVEAPRAVNELGEGTAVDWRSDGSAVVSLAVTNIPALVSWVLALGHRAEVLGPPEVRGAVISWLEETIGVSS